MTEKLLNKKNLIIVMMFIFLLGIPSRVYASVNISTVFNATVSGWYMVIRYVCLAVMLVGLLILGIKAAFSTIAEDKATFKTTIVNWVICLLIVLLLHQFIYMLIYTNESMVNTCKEWGEKLSGINPNTSSDEYDEVTLYDTAVSKAYELKFTSGTIGMILYIMLVVYTIKFFFIYLKRYINVLVLILIGPVVFTIYAFRKIIQGKGGLVGRWTKELIYNIFIQSVHAAFYSTLMGLTIKFMSDTLTSVGAVLTIILFGFIFQLDKIIRKLFNMVGGVSTVKVVDYESMLKHPVQTSKQFKEMAADGIQKAKELPANIQSKFKSGETLENARQGLVKFKDNAVSEFKETAQSLDGSKIEVSEEAIRKEKEKMANPSIPAKIFNGIQGFAYNTVGLGVNAVENISKKTKQELYKLKSFAKKQTEKLKQNTAMVKKIGYIIKNETKARIHKLQKGSKEKSIEEDKKETVLNLPAVPEEDIKELKKGIELSNGDIPAVVYSVKGPQAFIYNDVGSPYMGISILASENYEKRIYKEPVAEEDKKIIVLPSSIRLKNKVKDLDNETIKEERKVISIQEARKKYKFLRFNSTSVRNIIKGLNRRYIINDQALSTLVAVGQNITQGNMSFRGSAVSNKGYDGVRKSTIKYTAKLKSHVENKAQADIELGKAQGKEDRRGVSFEVQAVEVDNRKGVSFSAEAVAEQTHNQKVIQFPTAEQRKARLDSTVSNYHERVQDGNWAVLTTISNDVEYMHEEKIATKTTEIKKAEALEVVVNQLEAMGKSVKINEKVSVIFGKDIQENYKDEESENEETETEIIEAPKFVSPKSLEVISVINAVESKEALEAITDSAIIQTSIKFDTPLQDIKFGENEEAKKEVLDVLVEQGVISANVLNDNKAVQGVIEGIEDRKESLLNEKNSEYIDAIMENEVINSIKRLSSSKIETNGQDTFVDDEIIIDESFVEAEPNYDKLSEVVKQVAKAAVEVEAERVKNKLINEAQEIADLVYDEIEAAKEVYSLDELKNRNKDKKDKKEKIKIKSTFNSTKDNKNYGNETDNRETYIVYVMGAVVYEGRYELQSGSRIYEAIKAAGGPTDDADLTAIPYYEIIYDGQVIQIPKRSDDDTARILNKCRPIVQKVVQKYLIENNISDIDVLKKILHKKMLLSELQKALRNEPVTKNQIKNLLEKRIKELEFIRDGIKKAKGNMKVVKKGETKAKETENVADERARQQRGVRNKAEAFLDEAIKNINNFDENLRYTEESNEQMNDLLKQLDEQRELVLVNSSNSTKREARLRYIDETPENMMNKLLGRM